MGIIGMILREAGFVSIVPISMVSRPPDVRFRCTKPIDRATKLMNTISTTTAESVFGSGPSPDMEELDLSVRTRNAFCAAGANTIPKILELQAQRINRMRNAGEVSIKEVVRALLRRFYDPPWLRLVTTEFSYPEAERLSPQESGEIQARGWNRMTASYRPAEYWMLERAVSDMDRGGIFYKLIRFNDGVQIWRKGGVVMDDREEE